MPTKKFINIPLLFSIILYINSQFYTRVDLSKFPNTQIASAAVCPKCLRFSSDGYIGFYNCNSNIDQKFRLELENNDLGVFGIIKSIQQKSLLFSTWDTSYTVPKDVTYNLFEIHPVDDDGGHSIQIVNTNLCLFHEHTLSNTNTNNYISLFKTCDYTSRYFKFYFFKIQYTFPEYKVVGRVYVYTLKTSRVQSNLSVLKKSSLIKFTEKTSNKLYTTTFDSSSLNFNVQLPEGNWIINIEVSNDSLYYYKTDIPYYFPIIRCHENKDYWAEIPVRKFYTHGTNTSRGYRILFRLKAKFNIIIKKIYNMIAWFNTCSTKENYGRASGGVISNLKLAANGCIFVLGYIPIGATTDRGSYGDFVGIMNDVSSKSKYESITVYNGCEASGNSVLYHVDDYFFYSKKWWDCVRDVNPSIEVWDDREIYDSWDTKY